MMTEKDGIGLELKFMLGLVLYTRDLEEKFPEFTCHEFRSALIKSPWNPAGARSTLALYVFVISHASVQLRVEMADTVYGFP